MKKIINGKTYDTGTATEVCDITPPGVGNDPGNFRWEDTRLYLSPKGTFFIAGEGHAASRWKTSVGQNSWGPGDGLNLVSHTEARELFEEFGDPDDYAKFFGEPEEG